MQVISQSQLLGWMAWASIRGPIGGPRQDYYASYIAMHAGKPYSEEVSLDDFAMPWKLPEEDDEEED